jgi:diaminopimelate epimerase
MAGGEFCGNASMCAAVIAAIESGQNCRNVNLRVSGASGIVRAEVSAQSGGDWTGTVDMPQPTAIEEINLPGAGRLPVVRFEGISHVILQQEMSRDKAQELAPVWCEALGTDALGLLFLNQEMSSMTPLVYVPAAQTLCWEKSCASGTTAACAWLVAQKAAPHVPSSDSSVSDEHAPCSIRLLQPGGELQAEADRNGTIRLTGKVKLLRQGEAEIPAVS